MSNEPEQGLLLNTGVFSRYIKGEYALKWTFWPGFIVVSLTTALIINQMDNIDNAGVLFIGYLPKFIVLTATWNASSRYKGRVLWKNLARTWVLFEILWMMYWLVS